MGEGRYSVAKNIKNKEVIKMPKKGKNNRKEKIMLEEMVNAANELNSALGLEPEIDVELPIDKLLEKLKEAANLLMEDDELSEKTMDMLNKLSQISEEEESTKPKLLRKEVKKTRKVKKPRKLTT